MKTCFTRATIFLVSTMLFANIHAGEPSSSIQSSEQFEEFMQRYYLDPHPELVESAMHFVSESEISRKESAQGPLQMSFSCIFSQHPSERARWSQVISSLAEPAGTLMAKAMAKAPADLLSGVPMSAGRNDLNWSCFFATGSASYLDELLETLNHLDERKDMQKFLAAASAKWSLAGVAERDEKVRAAVLAMSVGKDPELSLVAKDILTKPISEIRADILETIKQQHEAGIW